MESFAKNLIMIGSLILFAGVVLYLFDKVNFIGKLPGDFLIKKKSFSLYIPLTTSIIFSIIVTIILNLFKK